MAISDEKLKIVINNYFKSECDVNTSIREAFEKGFRIGVKKGLMQIGADHKDEPTISKMEQVEDEPKTQMKTQKSNLSFEKADEPERNMAEDIVESFGFKAESYRQAKAKDEPQTERSE